MQITGTATQLRTTNLAASIAFYTEKLGFTLEFLYDDFYAGVRLENCALHLKLVDTPDPSIAFVAAGEHFHLYFNTPDVSATADTLKQSGVMIARDVHETAWGTRECMVRDPDGHTLYFATPLSQ